MKWNEFTDLVKADFENELQDCIAHEWNPCYHAANWNHLKARIAGQYAYLPDSLKGEKHERIQTEIDKVILEIQPKVENWLAYYNKYNKDGFYDSWIEIFWTEEKPDAETEEYYYMNRMYEKYLESGIIEIYDYRYSSDEEKEAFLQKWNLEYGVPYSENEEMSLYIGQKGKQGKFYECLIDFYMPQDSPKESDWWKLVSQIIKEDS